MISIEGPILNKEISPEDGRTFSLKNSLGPFAIA
jgi:hypothetical protein